MAIGPAGLVWVAANLFVEGRRLRWESQRSARLAEEMVAPAVAAGIRTGEIVIGLQAEIARAGEAAATASRQLEGLRTALQQEAEVQGWEVFIPDFQFCTDNAAMVAMTAHFQLEAGDVATQLVSPDPRLKLC